MDREGARPDPAGRALSAARAASVARLHGNGDHHLALGIGANAAMFNVVDRLMFRPLAHLRDPDTVHRIYWRWSDRESLITSMSTQYARYLDLRKWTTSFSQFAGFSERALAVGEGESAREPVSAQSARGSSTF